jgi:hypothetical protein
VLNDSVDLGKFASNITTELFETMVPAENNPITEPFKMGTNYTAREIRGLTIVLEKDDTYYDCSILEAAAADLLVTKYSGNLDIYPEYRRTAELLGKMVQKGWLTTDDLIRAQKTNGIKLIIGLILKKSEQSVTNNDILDVIRMFFAVYGGDEKEIKEKSEKVIRQRISNSP